MSQRLKIQNQWNDLGLVDLRSLEPEHRLDCPGEIIAAEDADSAYNIILEAFNLSHENDTSQALTPIGLIDIHGNNLKHIVEKRNDARERFVKYAIETIYNPFEIWSSEYKDGTKRFQFIGSFKSRNQMLVVVAQYETHTLWNFMHTEAKKLNKHRCGEIIYQRKKAAP